MRKFLTFIFAVSLNADFIICYSKLDLNKSLEELKLTGKGCLDNSKEMKKHNWVLNDMKIQDKKVIFIFKSKENKQNINQLIKDIKKKEKENKTQKLIEKGKNIYINRCQECHGKKGEVVFNKAIKDMSYEDLRYSFRDYEENISLSNPMYNVVQTTISNELKAISAYLKSLKDK